MGNSFDIFKFLLKDYMNNDEKIEFDNNIDLSSKEGINNAHKLIDTCKKDKLTKSILDSLNIDLSDLEKVIDNIFDTYENKNSESKKDHKVSSIERKEVDNSIEIPIKDESDNKSIKDKSNKFIKDKSNNDNKESVKEKDNNPFLELPSKTLPTNIGLQIHKLTQEYVDKYIKPYKSDTFTTEKINNVYSALYEFAAWIYQK